MCLSISLMSESYTIAVAETNVPMYLSLPTKSHIHHYTFVSGSQLSLFKTLAGIFIKSSIQIFRSTNLMKRFYHVVQSVKLQNENEKRLMPAECMIGFEIKFLFNLFIIRQDCPCPSRWVKASLRKISDRNKLSDHFSDYCPVWCSSTIIDNNPHKERKCPCNRSWKLSTYLKNTPF